MKWITTPVNPNAQQEVKNVLEYLGKISGNEIVLGQHTQTMLQEELLFVEKVTGELPALCGFELLAYSPNINYETSGEDCAKEIQEASGTIKKAWDWAKKKGLITFTWHWFSSLYGSDKAFYSEHTEFDASKAVEVGTVEHAALLSDMDFMAGLLKPFCDAHIPILWRPFHECDGGWFWWGRSGPETVRKLYRLMYERFTNKYRLDNLIWVFNSPEPTCYPGDDVVDIISRDMYPAAYCHTTCKDELEELQKVTEANKICAIGEIGPIPDVPAIIEQGIDWTYYMTWSKDFGRTDQFTLKEDLQRAYQNPHAVTLSRLPALY